MLSRAASELLIHRVPYRLSAPLLGIAAGVSRAKNRDGADAAHNVCPGRRTRIVGCDDVTNVSYSQEVAMASRVNHQEIVKKLIDTKAVDFKAIGQTFAEVGPGLALSDEPWETFCGTMRIFIRVFIIRGPIFENQLENLADLRTVSGAMKG